MHASATRTRTAARSARRRCLIRLTESTWPIDRAATLRNAEKLLRQGKLDAGDRGIPAHRRGSAARLEHRQHRSAICTSRAGQIDKAIEQFTRIADNLSDEGVRCRRPAPSTRRSSSSSPTTSTRCCRWPRFSASQGLLADARDAPEHADRAAQAEGRHARRAAGQDPPRIARPGRLRRRVSTAASARVEMGDKAGALRDLKEIAGELAATRARQAEAIDVAARGRHAQPGRRRGPGAAARRLPRRRRLARARECATTRRTVPDGGRGVRSAGTARRSARRRFGARRRCNPPTPS